MLFAFSVYYYFMLKNKSSKISTIISWLSVFDKLNLLIVFLFFIWAILFPIAYIAPIGPEGQTQTIRIIWIEHRKTSIIILMLLVTIAGMSINGKFKSWFLRFTGIGNDIYARFFQKGMIFLLLIFFGEIVIHLRDVLTQTINITRGYYTLGSILIGWLIIDFLFLQRNYKVQNTYNHIQTTITHEETHWEKGHQTFKNLFDE